MSVPVVVRARGLAVIVTTAVIAGVGLETAFYVAHHDELAWSRFVSFFYRVPAVVAVTMVAVAVVRARARHPVGQLFSFLALTIASAILANGYIAWELPGGAWIAWIQQVLEAPPFGILGLALLLFPNGRLPSPRWRWLLVVAGVQVSAAIGLAVFAPRSAPVYPNELPTPDNPLAAGGQTLADAAGLASGLGITVLLAAAVSLGFRWRYSGDQERLQVKWLAAAGLLFAVGSAILPVTLLLGLDTESGTPVEFLVGDAIFWLALTLVPAAMGVAIVRHRLYDVDRLISRTIVYSVLVVVLGATYVGSVVTAESAITSGTGSLVVSVILAGVVAVVFHPLRRWLQARVDRRVFGPRAEPYEVMARLAHELDATADPTSALERVAEIAKHALDSRAVEVSIRLPSGALTTAHSGDRVPHRGGDLVAAVVVDGDKTIGEIIVVGAGDRQGDAELLQQIAGLSTPALRNLRSLAELDELYQLMLDQGRQIATSRARLIDAVHEEHDRLQRQVRQRIEPRLTTIQEALPDVVETVEENRDDAVALCGALVEETTKVVQEIRDLSRGVLPPALADHGLAAALRSHLRRVDLDVELDAPASLEAARFDSSVETTTFLCCRAALDAAAVAATHATVSVDRRGDELHFAVRHDAPHTAGVPPQELRNERDLAETLLGGLHTQVTGDGTVVTGWVPLDAQATWLRKVSTA